MIFIEKRSIYRKQYQLSLLIVNYNAPNKGDACSILLLKL